MKQLLAATALALILTGPAANAAETTAAPSANQAATSTAPATAPVAANSSAAAAPEAVPTLNDTLNASGTDGKANLAQATVNGATEVVKTPSLSCSDDVVVSEAITDLQTAERQINKANVNRQHDQVLKDIKKALADLESSLK